MRARGQFQFTVLELVVLAASFAATSTVVFLLGIYVGRDIAGEHAPAGERVARLPIAHEAPIAMAARPRGAPELQFGPTAAEAALAAEAAAAKAAEEARVASERAATARRAAAAERERVARAEQAERNLAEASAAAEAARNAVAASEARAKAARLASIPKPSTKGPAAPNQPNVVTTARAYGSRAGDQPPTEYRTQRPARQGGGAGGAFLFTDPNAAPAPNTAGRPQPPPEPSRTNRAVTSKQRQAARARAPQPPPQPYRRPPPSAPTQVARPSQPVAGPAYTVQVLSTRDSGAADNLVRSLQSRGYGAYVRPSQDSTGRWFRVRVGRFAELSAARAMATRCRNDLRLDQAYVISD